MMNDVYADQPRAKSTHNLVNFVHNIIDINVFTFTGKLHSGTRARISTIHANAKL